MVVNKRIIDARSTRGLNRRVEFLSSGTERLQYYLGQLGLVELAKKKCC